MKRTLAAALASLFMTAFTSPAFAVLPKLPEGIYFGATASGLNTTSTNKLSFYSEDVIDAPIYNRNVYASGTQLQPGFLFGYQFALNSLWLFGAEVQANFFKSYINVGGSDYQSYVVTVNNQYGIQGRIGTCLTPNDNMIFAILGFAFTEGIVKINFDNSNMQTGSLGELQLNPINMRRHLSGFKFGAGYEKNFGRNYGLRIDYTHTQYGTFRTDLNDNVFGDILPRLGVSAISQSVDMLNLTILFIA